jgi:aromatic-L-amino-acid/L-tryptophan decarboxylase
MEAMQTEPGTRAFALEPSEDDRRQMGEAVLDYLTGFIHGLQDAPASNVPGAVEFARTLRTAPPEAGADEFTSVLDTIRTAASYGFETAGPGYLAFIPGGGLWSAALADFVATAVNRFVNISAPAPAFAQMEATVIRWFGDLFDHPPEAGGILTSGGSMANFSALVTARRAKLPEDFLSGTLYASEQTHASVAKAAMLAGFPPANVRSVPTDARLRIDPGALTGMVARDRAKGRTPFCLIANAGTTNTGAVDPFDALADIARDNDLWLHADAAYGGFFQLTERGRTAFRGIERADSITLDPHKALFLPYGTGCLLVRDRARLREAHQVGAAYLQDVSGGDEIPNFSDLSPELSRDFRGLRVWLPLVLHGLDAFRQALDEKLDLARYLYGELAATPGFEVPWEPDVTVVAFRYRPRSGDADAFTRALLDRINASRRVFLSSTLIDGRFVIRACILSHRTHRDRVEEAVDIIRRSAAELDR